MNNQEKLFIVKNANAVRRFLQTLYDSKNAFKLLDQAGLKGSSPRLLGQFGRSGDHILIDGKKVDFRELKKLLGQGSTVWENAKRVGMPRKTTMMGHYYRNPGGPLHRAGWGGPENTKLDRGIIDNVLANKNPLV